MNVKYTCGNCGIKYDSFRCADVCCKDSELYDRCAYICNNTDLFCPATMLRKGLGIKHDNSNCIFNCKTVTGVQLKRFFTNSIYGHNPDNN